MNPKTSFVTLAMNILVFSSAWAQQIELAVDRDAEEATITNNTAIEWNLDGFELESVIGAQVYFLGPVPR